MIGVRPSSRRLPRKRSQGAHSNQIFRSPQRSIRPQAQHTSRLTNRRQISSLHRHERLSKNPKLHSMHAIDQSLRRKLVPKECLLHRRRTLLSQPRIGASYPDLTSCTPCPRCLRTIELFSHQSRRTRKISKIKEKNAPLSQKSSTST